MPSPFERLTGRPAVPAAPPARGKRTPFERLVRRGTEDPAGFAIDTSRPRIENPDGSFSTERTITVGFDDRFYNIPTIWDGKQLSKEEAIDRASRSIGQGAVFPNFATLEEAITQARARSEEIGRVRGERPVLRAGDGLRGIGLPALGSVPTPPDPMQQAARAAAVAGQSERMGLTSEQVEAGERPSLDNEMTRAAARSVLGIGDSLRGAASALGNLSQQVADARLPTLPEALDRATRVPFAAAADALKTVGQGDRTGPAAADPRFARVASSPDFWKGMKEDPAVTLATHGIETVGNLAAVAIAGYATGGAGAILAGGSLEGGSAYNEAIQEGATEDQAATTAVVYGTVASVLEKFGANKILEGVFGEGSKTLVRRVVEASLAEGGTESVQELAQAAVAAAVYAGDEGLTLNDTLSLVTPENLKRYAQAGTLGALVGGGVTAVGGGLEQASLGQRAGNKEDSGGVVPPVSDPVQTRSSAPSALPTAAFSSTPIVEESRPTGAPSRPRNLEGSVRQQVELAARQPQPPLEPTPPAANPDQESGGLVLPEVLSLLQSGPEPVQVRVREKLAGALGRFTHGEGVKPRIDLLASLPQDPAEAARTVSHEVGHWVDTLTKDELRGNNLGHLASLAGYTKTWLAKEPDNLATLDRSAVRKEAAKEARQQRRPLQDVYREMIAAEMQRLGLLSRATVDSELRTLSEGWRPIPADATPQFRQYRAKPTEMYADFVSAVLTNPAYAERTAPETYAAWKAHLGAKPEFEASWLSLTAKTPEERLDSRLAAYQAGIREGAQKRAEQLDQGLEERDPRTLRQWAADSLLEKASILYEAEKKLGKRGAATDDFQEYSYRASPLAAYLYQLDELMLPVYKAGVQSDELGALVALRRAGEGDRSKLFNPLGEQGELALQIKARLEQRLGPERVATIEQALGQWWDLRNRSVIDRVERAGLVTPELLEAMRSNPQYARFEVADFIEKNHLASNDKGVSAILSRQFGTVRKIGDPVVETALIDVALIRLSLHNKAKQSAVQIVGEAEPGSVEEIEVPPGHFAPAMANLTVMDQGKLRAYRVPERLASALRNEEWSKAYSVAMDYFHRPASAVLVEFNPPWALRNLQRDIRGFGNRVVRGKYWWKTTATAALETFRAMPDGFRAVVLGKYHRDIVEMLERGAILPVGESNASAARLRDDQAMTRLLERYGVTHANPEKAAKLRRAIRGVGFALSAPGKGFELSVKLGGKRYLERNQSELGLTERQVAREIRQRVGTPDVLSRGELFRFTNTIALFSNVNAKGWQADFNTLKDRPGEIMAKLAVSTMSLVLIKAAAYHGWFGEDWEKFFKQIPDRDLRNYQVLPIGFDASGNSVWVPLHQDYFEQSVGALMWGFFSNSDKNKVASVGRFVYENMPWSPDKLHPVLKQVFSTLEFELMGRNPVDFRTGRPIIPDEVFEAGPYTAEAQKLFGAWTWNSMGGSTVLRLRTTINDGPDPKGLEKALGLPIFGQIAGVFVRSSRAGADEIAMDISKEERQGDARKSLARKIYLRDALRDDPDADPVALQEGLRALGLEYKSIGQLREVVSRMKQRKSNNPYERALAYRPSKETKEKLQSELEPFRRTDGEN